MLRPAEFQNMRKIIQELSGKASHLQNNVCVACVLCLLIVHEKSGFQHAALCGCAPLCSFSFSGRNKSSLIVPPCFVEAGFYIV